MRFNGGSTAQSGRLDKGKKVIMLKMEKQERRNELWRKIWYGIENLFKN
jgi:hypothetical protein